MAFSLATLAGLCEKTVVYPLDVVKTRLQLQRERFVVDVLVSLTRESVVWLSVTGGFSEPG